MIFSKIYEGWDAILYADEVIATQRRCYEKLWTGI